jgi:probable rRNA maturation factor
MKRVRRRTRASHARRKAIPKIIVLIDDERWRKDPAALRLIRRAARLVLGEKRISTRRPERTNVGAARLPRSRRRKTGGSLPGFPHPFTGEALAKRAEGGPFVSILLADDARLKSLNRDFRGKNKPTNVLSFPSAQPGYLGDVAMAYRTVAHEARVQGKRFAHHAAHLALHGVLHLLGYDHLEKCEASAMESLEIEQLAKLGIASPYVLRPLTTGKKAA